MESGVTLKATITNPDVGDRALDEQGRAVLLDDLAAEVAQRLHIRLNFFKGEWFLNLNSGVPYYQRIFRKAPSDKVIRAVFRKLILGCPGVAGLDKFAYSLSNRTLRVTFTARLDNGARLVSSDYPPFEIGV